MKRIALAAVAAGTMLLAVPPSALAEGWQPTNGGSVSFALDNPCTSQPTDFTVSWSESLLKATKSGTVRSGLTGTYTATDGSSGTVRTTSSTTYTKDGYADTYHQVLLGQYDGHTQRISFVFRVVVGQDVDVKVQRWDGSCGG